MQKQKEAKYFYEEETKKMKLLEKLKIREDKFSEIKQKKREEKVRKIKNQFFDFVLKFKRRKEKRNYK